MSFKPPLGDKNALQRRTYTNPKYDHVLPVVETGMTSELAQYMQRGVVKIRRQPGELFQRLRTSVIGDYLQSKQEPELLEDGGFARPMDEYRGAHVANAPDRVEYLILDCRSEEDFEQCHIAGALHYPRIRLNHAMNPLLPEMYAYRNKENKVIVIYDFAEECVASFANIVYQKGVDNVAIIAGGMAEFLRDYRNLTVGECHIDIPPRDVRLKRRADEITLARSEAVSTIHKPKSLCNSLARPRFRNFNSTGTVGSTWRPSNPCS